MFPPDGLESQGYFRFHIVKFLLKETCRNSVNVVYQVRKEGAVEMDVQRLVLRDTWALTPPLEPGALVNVCDVNPDENGDFVVERNAGYLIVEPDKLVSVTSVCSLGWCERKVAFSEYFRFPGDSIDTLRGTLAHDLICQVMLKRKFRREEVIAELEELITRPVMLERAYALGLSHTEWKSTAMDLVDSVRNIETLMSPTKANKQFQIMGVEDIEDCIWSPKYGLKGKVDCTVVVKDQRGNQSVVPLEFKTGQRPGTHKKTVVRDDHLGQVYLYALMMEIAKTPNGILHYIREDQSVECGAQSSILQSLVMARNRIVMNLQASNKKPGFTGLPRPCNVSWDAHCKRCEYRNVCGLSLSKQVQETDDKSSVEKELIASVSLIPEERDFFNKWFDIVKLEYEEENQQMAKTLWLETIESREAAGRCVGQLLFHSQIDGRQNCAITFSFDESKAKYMANFVERDFVVIGSSQEPCVGYAFIEKIEEGVVTVSLEKPLRGRHLKLYKKFTMDKISSQSFGTSQFVNLTKLMDNSELSIRLRNSLILKKMPGRTNLPLENVDREMRQILLGYNKDQKEVLLSSLTTESILLVKGSPGCGKTSTIVGLIRLLVQQKKTVLVSAYTNNALDNILLSYKKHSNGFLRVGAGGKLSDEELKENSINQVRDRAKTVDELRDAYNNTPVIATTLLGVKHPIFSVRKFDYCIVDEGSQALPPVLIGALMQAEKWIVFGDPNQLPATIKSRKIKESKIEENVFSMLDIPEFSRNLSVQYRMNQSIMKIANQLLYNNEMRCANQVQAGNFLKLPVEAADEYLRSHYPVPSNRSWLCLAASRKPQRSLVFFDTKNMEACDSPTGTSLQNVKESEIVQAIVEFFIGCEVQPKDIGVIAPYRGQVQTMRDALSRLQLNVEVNTVDQYQGREKKIVIVSFTKSTPASQRNKISVSEESILNDIRRLNVAITRATSKVILIGDSDTLTQYPACNKLLSLLNGEQIYSFASKDFSTDFFKSDACNYN